jgi:hypothetical protein
MAMEFRKGTESMKDFANIETIGRRVLKMKKMKYARPRVVGSVCVHPC